MNTSCTSDSSDEMLETKSEVIDFSDVDVIVKDGEVTFLNPINEPVHDFSQGNAKILEVDDIENMVQLRAGTISDVHQCVGCQSQKFYKTIKMGFSGTAPGYYHLNGTYLVDIIEYYYDVSIPKGATFIYPNPSKEQDLSNMGYLEPMSGNQLGYKKYDYIISSTSKNDVYRLRTYVYKITHNILGQQVGPYLWPASAKNPSKFCFKWAWSTDMQW
jgi:hypothetical protein